MTIEIRPIGEDHSKLFVIINKQVIEVEAPMKIEPGQTAEVMPGGINWLDVRRLSRGELLKISLMVRAFPSAQEEPAIPKETADRRSNVVTYAKEPPKSPSAWIVDIVSKDGEGGHLVAEYLDADVTELDLRGLHFELIK